MAIGLDLERGLWAEGAQCVAGVDEVGRGPLAGPVVAAAVVLDPACWPEGLDDSKKLSAKRRVALTEELRACAEIGVGMASVEEIDQINILQASLLAMRRAVEALPCDPDRLLIDGRNLFDPMPCSGTAVVGGDGVSFSIAAASIIAKTHRDALMMRLAEECPGYGWETNMGYPTRCHINALRDLGVTPHHRRSFAPVHKILCQENSVSP